MWSPRSLSEGWGGGETGILCKAQSAESRPLALSASLPGTAPLQPASDGPLTLAQAEACVCTCTSDPFGTLGCYHVLQLRHFLFPSVSLHCELSLVLPLGTCILMLYNPDSRHAHLYKIRNNCFYTDYSNVGFMYY